MQMKIWGFLADTPCVERPDPYYPHILLNAGHVIAIIPPKKNQPKKQTNNKTQHNSVKVCVTYSQVKCYDRKKGQKITLEVLKHHPEKY